MLFICTSGAAYDADEGGGEWDVSTPPGQSSEISIETTEGTWMSLDVSPDGKKIAFDLLGDIYIVPMEGGEAKRINGGLSWSMQPRFSPDGTQIAYIGDAGGADNIWIMQADGSNSRQLTHESFRLLSSPYWLPSGDFVAARKHFTTSRSLGTGEIWIYDIHRGGGVAVIARPEESHQKELGEPAFSMDGVYLYYTANTTPGGTFEYGQDTNGTVFEIVRHELFTGQTDSIVSRRGGAVRPTPSRDGRYLAFVGRIRTKSALFIKDLRTGSVESLDEDLDQDMQETWAVQGVYPNMSWTPDSSSVVYWARGSINKIDIESRKTSEIRFHVQDTRKMLKPSRPSIDITSARFKSRITRHAEVSPDGKRVVYEAGGRLYLMNLPDGKPKVLTEDLKDHFELYPSWSRDGQRIVFVSWDDIDLGSVRTVSAHGGISTILTDKPGHYHRPRYSPDGTKIVFEKRSPGAYLSPNWAVESGIFQIRSDGGEAALITKNGLDPQWGKHADRLYVTRREPNGNKSLISINLSGHLLRIHGTSEFAEIFSVSPDERFLAIRENFDVYLMPLPPGGQVLEIGSKSTSNARIRVSAGGNFPHWTGAGRKLHWSRGAELFGATVEDILADPLTPDNSDTERQPISMSVQLDADIPHSKLALVGGRIITMSADDGGVIDDGVVIVEGNRLTSVGTRREISIPDSITTIDVSGKTIMPGLIDVHGHIPYGNHLIPEQHWALYATLALGVTTVHDPSNSSAEIFTLSEMQRSGRILGPRIYSSGNAVYGARSAMFADIGSLEDARNHVRRLEAEGAISVKSYMQPRRDQRQQLVAAAREAEMLVPAEGGSLFHMDMSLIADGVTSIEHNLPQSALYQDVVQFWSQSAVAYTPTLVVSFGGLNGEQYWYEKTDVWKHPLLSRFVPPAILQERAVRRVKAPDQDYNFLRAAAVAKVLSDSGVIVNIGGHGQREGLASHWEMWSLVEGGMSTIEALRCATISPAKTLGIEESVGSLESGKLADLVVVDGDVLASIRKSDRVAMVMLNGRLYDAETLNEMWTGDRRSHPFYWH